MPRTGRRRKEESFNFRIDPALKAAFVAEDRAASSLLRDFMQTYVARRERRAFVVEARKQSRAIAARAGDPEGDEAWSLRELDALLEADDLTGGSTGPA